MPGGNAIRGTRVGSGPTVTYGETAEAAPRVRQAYWCGRGHRVEPSFAVEADVPEMWDCPRCGYPAGKDRENPPEAPRNEPYKTHLAYVKERRSDEDGAALLNEALNELKQRREQI